MLSSLVPYLLVDVAPLLNGGDVCKSVKCNRLTTADTHCRVNNGLRVNSVSYKFIFIIALIINNKTSCDIFWTKLLINTEKLSTNALGNRNTGFLYVNNRMV